MSLQGTAEVQVSETGLCEDQGFGQLPAGIFFGYQTRQPPRERFGRGEAGSLPSPDSASNSPS